MSETGIEAEERYNRQAYRTLHRVHSGVHFLVWLAVYGAAVAVLFLDLMYWRAG